MLKELNDWQMAMEAYMEDKITYQSDLFQLDCTT